MIEARDLSLYTYEGCGYSARVCRVLARLGVAIELRDIDRDEQHEADLVAARGQRTVPVLRVTKPDGADEWLGESRDIVAYLERRFSGTPTGTP